MNNRIRKNREVTKTSSRSTEDVKEKFNEKHCFEQKLGVVIDWQRYQRKYYLFYYTVRTKSKETIYSDN